MVQFFLGFGVALGAALVAVGIVLKWGLVPVGPVGRASQSVEGYDELQAKHDLISKELAFCRQQLAITKIELGGQVARATALESALSALNSRDHAMACENIELSALVDELQAEVRGLRSWLEKYAPDYVHISKRDDRAAMIRELSAKGWSNHKIERAVFGYTGGGAYQEVKRTLNALRRVPGTSLARITKD